MLLGPLKTKHCVTITLMFLYQSLIHSMKKKMFLSSSFFIYSNFFDMPSINKWTTTNWTTCPFSCHLFTDTEIPIQLPQSPSPPPIQPQTHQQHRAVQEHQQTTHQLSNGPPPQHRPLLHGLLSGTHLSQASYHRGYSSSSTGKRLFQQSYIFRTKF